jgi:pantoate--beta-alanine ligase
MNIAEVAGATAIFAPDEATIYPGGIEKISAGEIGDLYEGASRPGHFTGVLTVVKRLFDLIKPEAAVFGEKDFQQLFLIKKMVSQLNLPIEIISAPTIREKNGLAISSRNIRLDKNGEKIAEVIYKALNQPTIEQMKSEVPKEPGFELDYLEVIDELTFEKAKSDTQNKRVIIAGWVNHLRLIDNMPMGMRK